MFKFLVETVTFLNWFTRLNKQDVLGVENHPALVGAATNGAAVNVGEHNSMRA